MHKNEEVIYNELRKGMNKVVSRTDKGKDYNEGMKATNCFQL